MKILEFVRDTDADGGDRVKIGCRGIIVKDGRVLLSHELGSDAFMIPGGGMEEGETGEECCAREVAEEAGLRVRPSECALEIRERYAEGTFVSRYYVCEIVGSTEKKLTEREKAVGLVSEWPTVEDAIAFFARYEEFAENCEPKRRLYRREWTALTHVLGGR